MYGKTLGLKEELALKEVKLADAKKVEAQNGRIGLMIRNKVEFDRRKCFKRQNSYTMLIADFGDMDDFDKITQKKK